MTDEEYQIRRKYENRNLMQELEWVSHYPPSGMSNQDKAFIRWLAMTAYDKINELEQTSVPVHDMELILHEVAKPQWISVTETLPVNTNPVLIVHRGGVSTGWYNGRYWERGANTNHRPIQTVTHWMPFPEPPKEGE